MWISLRGLAGEGGGSGGVENCISMKVQVSQSWNKQLTFTVLPLPFTLSGVTTTFLEGVGGSHCLHILVPFASQHLPLLLITLWKLLSPRSPVNSRKETSEVPSQAPLLWCDSPHPILPTSHTLSFLDHCEVVSLTRFFCWTMSGFRFYHNFLKDVCPNSQSYF